MTSTMPLMLRKLVEPLILALSLLAAAFFGGWDAVLGVLILFALWRLGTLFSA